MYFFKFNTQADFSLKYSLLLGYEFHHHVNQVIQRWKQDNLDLFLSHANTCSFLVSQEPRYGGGDMKYSSAIAVNKWNHLSRGH